MKTHWKRILAFALILALTAGVFAPAASALDGQDYAVGDLVLYGSYPQAKVTDDSLIAALNAAAQDWTSYGYYSGSSGATAPSDIMQYCDVTLDGAKYRGVHLTQNRPSDTYQAASSASSGQDELGYLAGETYWFLWEPLVWRVLDPSTGFVLCQSIIDSQPYNNIAIKNGLDAHEITAYWGDAEQKYFANNYAHSSIRAFLTDGTDENSFFSTAFTSAEQSQIYASWIDNSAYNDDCALYASERTCDRVFLLSVSEALDPAYGLHPGSGMAIDTQARATDYAKCQGVPPQTHGTSFYGSGECSCWNTRTTGADFIYLAGSNLACGFDWYGELYYQGSVTSTVIGVRPAMRVNLAMVHVHVYTLESMTATCVNSGLTTYVCDCGARYSVETAALGHAFGAWSLTTEPTPDMPGEETRICSRCQTVQTRPRYFCPYATGDLIEFGSYPQTKVTDDTLADALNDAAGTWTSYDYYTGTGRPSDGQMHSDDYMEYCDVTYAGEMYRGVRMTQYRSLRSSMAATSDDSNQDENGYYIGRTYWFRYEPIVWRVLDPAKGLVVSENILDAQTFHNYYIYSAEKMQYYGDPECRYHANNYAHSDIRDWLTDEADAHSFYNTAFTAAQQDAITLTELSNLADRRPTSKVNYDAEPTTDRVFLLSGAEMRNDAYGLYDAAGFPEGSTDYAACQGMPSGASSSNWILRSAVYLDYGICLATNDGLKDGNMLWTVQSICGIRPALSMDTTAASVHTHTYTACSVTLPGCETPGSTTCKCICGHSITEDCIAARGHRPSGEGVVTPASCTAQGYTTYTCARCGQSCRDDFTDALGHDYRAAVVDPTCTAQGYTLYTCERCGDSYRDAYTDALGHAYNAVVREATCIEDGCTTHTCARCLDTYTEAVVPASGHNFGEWTVETAATAAAAGRETRECAYCLLTESRSIPPVGAVEGFGFFSGGYGTEDAPFLISNASDFDHIDDFYAQYGDALPSSPVYFRQTANIKFYYYDPDDTDGATEYTTIDPWEPDNPDPEWGYPARPVPVSQMHDAVYDGGGYLVYFDSCYNQIILVGGEYVGVFGLVTNSTIRNLEIDLWAFNMLSRSASPSIGGAIGRAENCTLDNLDVYIGEYMPEGVTGLLAGSVTGCHVTNCYTNAADGLPSFIGGASSDYTFSNVWAAGNAWNEPAVPDAAFLQKVTGVLLSDGPGMEGCSAKRFMREWLMVDSQGVLYTPPVQCEPDAVGLVLYRCFESDNITIAAGAHGSVVGAGVYTPYECFWYGDPEVTYVLPSGIVPVPDAGYVFAEWEITQKYPGLYTYSMELQEDGTYTFQNDRQGYYGYPVTATAQFEPGSYTLAYNMNGLRAGNIPQPASHRCIDDVQIVNNAPAISTLDMLKYRFLGWNTEPDGSGTMFRIGETTAPLSTEPGSTVTLYAIWERIPVIMSLETTAETVAQGSTVTFTVETASNPGVAGMALALTYDPDALTLTEVCKGDMLRYGDMTFGSDLAAVSYPITWSDTGSAANHTETGTILSLVFTVKDTATLGRTAVSLSYDADGTFDKNGNPVPLRIGSTYVTVRERLPEETPGYGFFSGGFGTEDDPFQIATATDFDHIDDFYTAYGDDLPCDPVYFTQTADIDFFCYMDEDNHWITDGTQGYAYCQAQLWDGWTKPTPVSVMHNAVYDGGGKTISINARNEAYCILGNEYAGLFGLVTDSTIRNLNIDLGYGNCVICSNEAYTSGGAVGRAENCMLDNISIYVVEYMNQSPDGLLAGSAANCHVTNCFTNNACHAPSLIGGADSTYTCSNVWIAGEGISGLPDSTLLDKVTGVILADGNGVSTVSVQQMLEEGSESFVLVDTQGVVQQHPVPYDPDETGILLYRCPAEIVTVEAGEHGSVTGAGVYHPYTQIFTQGYDAPKVITGLTPVPDTGYVFTGWKFSPPEPENSQFARTMTLQPDGSYTYSSTVFNGIVTVTANFAPHEAHTFGVWQVTTQPTTETEGEKTRTCTVCGATETQAIPPALPAAVALTVPASPVHTGDTITVTVDLTENPGLAAMSLTVAYDPAVLTLTDAQRAGMLTSGTATIGSIVPFTAEWVDALADNHTETGTILTLTFTVNENAAAGNTQVTLSYEAESTFNRDLIDVPLRLTDAMLAVLLHTPGDSNGDGSSDGRDVAALLRYLAGWDEVSVDERNADVNGDGKVNLKDVTLLRRYLAGWNITLV